MHLIAESQPRPDSSHIDPFLIDENTVALLLPIGSQWNDVHHEIGVVLIRNLVFGRRLSHSQQLHPRP
jgi:hypothetical protein